MDDPIDGGLTRVEQGGQRSGGQVGVQMDQHQQHPGCQRQAPGPPRRRRQPMVGRGAHGVDLTAVEPGERHQVSVAVWQVVVVGGGWFHDRHGRRAH
jgi:hypothetical protein